MKRNLHSNTFAGIADFLYLSFALLGAWLDAELSNPNCPWHKKPYPKNVLAANQLKNEINRTIRLANL